MAAFAAAIGALVDRHTELPLQLYCDARSCACEGTASWPASTRHRRIP